MSDPRLSAMIAAYEAWEVDDTAPNSTEGMCMALLRGLDALTPPPAHGPVWQHVKRGTTYTEIGRAELQIAKLATEIEEGATLVIYRGEDGKLWAREAGEFEDGRFRRMSAPPPASPGVPVRVAVAMTYIPDPDEKWGHLLVLFSDGILRCRNFGTGQWIVMEGPLS